MSECVAKKNLELKWCHNTENEDQNVSCNVARIKSNHFQYIKTGITIQKAKTSIQNNYLG